MMPRAEQQNDVELFLPTRFRDLYRPFQSGKALRAVDPEEIQRMIRECLKSTRKKVGRRYKQLRV